MLQKVMSLFSVEDFLCHSAESFRRGTVLCCFSENFWQREKLWIRGRGKYHDILPKIFCLTVPEKSEEEPFCAVLQ